MPKCWIKLFVYFDFAAAEGAKNIESKIRKELEDMLKENREDYEIFI